MRACAFLVPLDTLFLQSLHRGGIDLGCTAMQLQMRGSSKIYYWCPLRKHHAHDQGNGKWVVHEDLHLKSRKYLIFMIICESFFSFRHLNPEANKPLKDLEDLT